jgi:diphosphomevalonate decarboxylase
LINQDLPTFGNLLEQEALEMHSIMMTATPAIHYVRPEAWELLATMRKWRQETGCHAYFTLDAGSNPHIISPLSEQKNVVTFLQSQYPKYTVLIDKIGNAPKLSCVEGLA